MNLATTISRPDIAPLQGAALEAILPQRFPFLLLDRIDSWEPMRHATGCKAVGSREPYLLHDGETEWPMPFVIESLGQLAIALFNLSQPAGAAPKVLLGNVSGVTYHAPIPLGSHLDLDVRIERVIDDQFIASGLARLHGVPCMEMDSLICKILTREGAGS